MADDWEDWEAEDYQPQLPSTVGQAALAKAGEPDPSKFAGEDEDAADRPAWENNIPKTQQVRLSFVQVLLKLDARVLFCCRPSHKRYNL